MPKQVIWSCKNEKKYIYYLPTVNLKVSTGKNVHAFRADITQNEKKNMLQHIERCIKLKC